jgi:hypothetical protein
MPNLIDMCLNAIKISPIRVVLSLVDSLWEKYPIETRRHSCEEDIQALGERILKKANVEDIEKQGNGTTLTDARLSRQAHFTTASGGRPSSRSEF